MVSPFLAPKTLWHMMYTKADAVGMTQRVEPFLDCMGATTVEHQQGIADLIIAEFANSTMAQRKGIMTSLVPLPAP